MPLGIPVEVTPAEVARERNKNRVLVEALHGRVAA